jgi:hypothetical protein
VLDALKLVRAMPRLLCLCYLHQAKKDGPIEEVNNSRGFYRMLKRIGISKVERRAAIFATRIKAYLCISLPCRGVPVFVIKTLAGHKSMEMTGSYSHAENVLTSKKRQRIFQRLFPMNGRG